MGKQGGTECCQFFSLHEPPTVGMSTRTGDREHAEYIAALCECLLRSFDM